MNDKTQERAIWHTQKVRMPYAPAIEAMQAIVDLANDTITDPAYVIAASMALDALKREAAEAVNDPLTLEELRGMEGKPVWAVLTPSRTWELTGSCWIIVKWDYVDRLAHSPIGNMFDSDYGKTWLAYRRKPEEGEHE